MKKIVYNNKQEEKIFWLTEKEFQEAFSAWESKTNYWCPRLESSLSPFYMWVETPPDELGYDIFWLFLGGDTWQKIYQDKESGELLQEIENETGEKKKVKRELSETEKKNLVSQEDYYQYNLKKLE